MASIITLFPIDKINSAKYDVAISTKERKLAFTKYTRYASKTEGKDEKELAKLKENYEIKKFNLESRKDTLSRILAHEAEQPLDVLRVEISQKIKKMYQLRNLVANEPRKTLAKFSEGYTDAYRTFEVIISESVDAVNEKIQEDTQYQFAHRYSRDILWTIIGKLIDYGTAPVDRMESSIYGDHFHEYSSGYKAGMESALKLVLDLHTELTRYDDNVNTAVGTDPESFKHVNLSVWE